MTTSNLTLSTGADEQLAAVVEEITAKLEQGERVDLSDYSSIHPEQIEQLRKLMPALEALALVGHVDPVINGHPNTDGPDANGHHQLGDFRLVREIGRGGMGVVYEAEQLSLGRRVALKVLPFAALLDRQQLARFKNEARAAATLDHPNIVAVHSVGCERSVHFYAMQLIEGRSLAEIIAQLNASQRKEVRRVGRDHETRQRLAASNGMVRHAEATHPTATAGHEPRTMDTEAVAAVSTVPAFDSREYFRTAAQLGIQAAKALDHAHSHGIMHRDVKPGNLLIDDAGKLWITDFGLARIEADAGMTITGDLLGTLRYMSPEQALAKRVVVDHRSDIYSLGVTLYELLTLQPAYAGTDRQELLRQIAFEEPRRPRQINPRIPFDLETIISKAIEKNPADRYATARELANDLRRFLEDKPIEAHRPSLLDRAAKWARRHAALASIAAAALGIVAIVGAAAALLTLRAYTSEIEHRKAAEVQRTAAEENLSIAAESIDKMLARVADSQYAHGDLTHAQPLASDATEFYERLLKRTDDPKLRFRAAKAYHDVANIWLLLDVPENAGAAIKRARELIDRLIRQFPEQPEYLRELARNHETYGLLQSKFGLYFLTEWPYRTAWEIRQDLVERFPHEPEYKLALANALMNLASSYSYLGQLDDAEKCHRQLTEIYSQVPVELANTPARLTARAGSLSNLAQLACKRKQFGRALRHINEAIDLQKRSLDKWPTNPIAVDFFYKHHAVLATIYIEAGRHADAAAAVETLIQTFPKSLQAYHDGAIQLLSCAELACKEGLHAAVSGTHNLNAHIDLVMAFGLASDYRKRALEFMALANKADIRTPDTVCSFVWFLLTCDDKSFRDPELAVELAKSVTKEVPTRSEAWMTLALARYRVGDWSSAEEAIQSLYKNVSNCECNPTDWLLLSMIRARQGRTDEAQVLYAKSRKLIDEKARDASQVELIIPEVDQILDHHQSLAAEAEQLIKHGAGRPAVKEPIEDKPRVAL